MSLRRVNLSLDPAVHDALLASAQQHGVRVATLARQIVAAGLLGGAPDPSGHIALPATPPDPASPATPTPADADRAQWLQLDRGDAWRSTMWQAAEKLRVDYPDLAEHTGADWTSDRFTRDGLLALVIWRTDLDAGDQTDPRLEHQWLTALRDFKRMLEERSGFRGAPVRLSPRPPGW